MTLSEGVPAWVLRGTVLLATAVITLLLLANGVALAGLIGLFGLVASLVPASPAAGLTVITTAVCAAIRFDSPLDITVLVLLPLVHLVHIGSALAAVIPGTARVHPSALRPAAIRFAVVQTTAFAAAAIAAIAPKSVLPTGLEIAGLLAAAGVVVVAARLILNRPQ
ncbi:hypothetical protein [Actinocrispum sp. NPDC049592]|uniref:hypothetical protein n=1 Tax=Actinocrispum sp. NPDC049592 TaxID=3154835 RepID=UPI00342B1930